MKTTITTLAVLLSYIAIHAAEYHVSVTGLDSNQGSRAMPFKTVSAAAKVARPGDVITVHAGTYRERINPPRGGTSDDRRIVYQAAQGEAVTIKGSEVIKGWKKQPDGTWLAILPNAFFGDYNPYKDLIAGDWFMRNGRDHHTGEIYLNGKALFEEVSLEKLKARAMSWFATVDGKQTRIWANFGASDPRPALVEANVRATVFYPDQPGRNYITVRGFVMRHAASQWAAPTSEQTALIGTHWSKGWIIENNVISDSKCVGVTLGKHGDEFDNTSANSAVGYVKTIERGLAKGWSKDKIGSHIVRDNTISHCGAAGICGSLGGAFSRVTGNHIFNINYDKPFAGHEQAGIKFHAPIDMLIANNRIHQTSRGIWLDWMTQGTRVTRNLLYDNGSEDLFTEVNHGPSMVDNNICLTKNSLKDHSQGGAFVHNLFAGAIEHTGKSPRKTPYHKAHSTEIAGLSNISGGDNRFYNNILTGGGLDVYNESKFPVLAGGNVYLNGSNSHEAEKSALVAAGFNPNISVVEEGAAVYLELTLPERIESQSSQLVTTKLLGKARVPGLPYLNPDGSPITVDTDYFGKKRDRQNPTAGPFENPGKGKVRLKVW